MATESADPVIAKARELLKESGKTLEEVGIAMGFAPSVARKSVWQLLNKIDDPRIGTLRKFAAAIGASMSDFFPTEKKSRSK